MAVGGAAYLVAKAIRKSRVLAFEDLGMEAIYEFEVKDMPVTVAVDANGASVHTTGPAEWSRKIIELKLPVTQAYRRHARRPHLRSRPARRPANAKHLMPTEANKAWIRALAARRAARDRGRLVRAAEADPGDGGHRRDRSSQP